MAGRTEENSAKQYSESSFWKKLQGFAIVAGREVVEKVLTLFYTAQRPETPLWAKTVIYSAIAYFILPTDLIPDFAPLAGYTDDMGTVATALATVAMCITPEIQAEAKKQAQTWFREDAAQSAAYSSDDHPIREISIE